jgi:hypothetical protein
VKYRLRPPALVLAPPFLDFVHTRVEFEERSLTAMTPIPDPQTLKGDDVLFYETLGYLARVVHGWSRRSTLLLIRGVVRVLAKAFTLWSLAQQQPNRPHSPLTTPLIGGGPREETPPESR